MPPRGVGPRGAGGTGRGRGGPGEGGGTSHRPSCPPPRLGHVAVEVRGTWPWTAGAAWWQWRGGSHSPKLPSPESWGGSIWGERPPCHITALGPQPQTPCVSPAPSGARRRPGQQRVMPLFGNSFSPKKTPPRKWASLSNLHLVSPSTCGLLQECCLGGRSGWLLL